jgi:hypothetical protein
MDCILELLNQPEQSNPVSMIKPGDAHLANIPVTVY